MNASINLPDIEIYLGVIMKTHNQKIIGKVVAHNARTARNVSDIVMSLELPDGSQQLFKRPELTYATEEESRQFHAANISMGRPDTRIAGFSLP